MKVRAAGSSGGAQKVSVRATQKYQGLYFIRLAFVPRSLAGQGGGGGGAPNEEYKHFKGLYRYNQADFSVQSTRVGSALSVPTFEQNSDQRI